MDAAHVYYKTAWTKTENEMQSYWCNIDRNNQSKLDINAFDPRRWKN